jgi:hypothetical protein
MANETVTLDEALDVSKRLSSADQLRLISLLSERLRSKMDQGAEPVDMLSLAGLGADIWREIDVDEYLEQERASWEN